MTGAWTPPAGLFRRDPAVVTFDWLEGPPLTPEMVRRAEDVLGARLPASYLALLEVCNGGYLQRRLGHPTTVATSWADDHVGVGSIAGIPAVGDDGGILRSPHLTREWGLPETAVLLDGDGHTWVALDYDARGDDPPVVWFDVDLEIVVPLAPDFATFADSLHEYP